MKERLNSNAIRTGGLLVGVCVLFAAVASEGAAPQGRFSAMPDTVRDNVTGLVWQRTASASTYTWANASSHCANLSGSGFGGYSSGWRLPTIKELQTIVDIRVNPSIDGTAFPSTPAAIFWSSSIYAGNTSSAWMVGFSNGFTGYNSAGTSNWVRCVR